MKMRRAQEIKTKGRKKLRRIYKKAESTKNYRVPASRDEMKKNLRLKKINSGYQLEKTLVVWVITKPL